MRRRRWRTVVLWAGSTLCVLIVMAFVVSAWWEVAIQIPTTLGPAILLVGGSMSIFAELTATTYRHQRGLSYWNDWGWGGEFWFEIEFPLYALFLAIAIPTLFVWRLAPKFPSGHCRRCGYNLTGLTEARCPECGQPFEPKGDAR